MTVFVPDPVLLSSPRGRPWPDLAGPRTPPSGPLPSSADVVIVGAGPAGLAVAGALWHLGIRDVVMLDADGRPCGRFFDRIDTLGQRVLRSPYGHHPGVEGYRDCELLDFARLHWAYLTPVERREVRMTQAGHRSVVPVDVFEAYCRHLAAVHDVRVGRATVTGLDPMADAVVVRSTAGPVTARYVVLCLGESRRPAPGHWTVSPDAAVSHWDSLVPPGLESITVVGAGLSSAHLIANALDAGQRVNWVVRGRERYQCNDVNAAFFRAEGRARFTAGIPWHDRLDAMRRERRASVMFEFRPLFRAAEDSGRLTVFRGRPVSSVGDRPGVVRFGDGARVAADQVVLALGTVPSTGSDLLGCAEVDGWPELDDRMLCYTAATRVFAVGAAAGMILGPAARNIDGHRVATARVATTIANRLGTQAGSQAGSQAGTAVAEREVASA